MQRKGGEKIEIHNNHKHLSSQTTSKRFYCQTQELFSSIVIVKINSQKNELTFGMDSKSID
jgi:hypothetical protein